MAEKFYIDNPNSIAFEVEPESRTIRGLALPFGDVAESGGRKWRFSKGSTSWGKVKVLDGHDWSRAVGTAGLTETDEGLFMTAKIARGARGDEVLSLAEAGVYDGLSVGLGAGVKAVLRGDVNEVTSALILEVSLTPLPAFERAAIISVAASAVPNTEKKESDMDETKVEAPVLDATAVFGKIEDLNTKLETFMAVPPRERVKAGEGVIREEAPYRFNGTPGAHGFLNDIIASKHGAGDAGERLNSFLAETFANIATGDVDELNPAPTRSELYVAPLHYTRPLWNLVTKGALDDITSFIIPKFGAVSGNPAAAHTQGVEPTEFTLTSTSQTITPSAISGLAILNREVVDQGGNPKVDQIVWNEMLASYFESMETSIATALATGTGPEINLGGGATDSAKVKLLQQALAALQFVKGGDRFSAFAGDPALYGLLAAAQDDMGRPLFPTLGATNADGSKRASMESVQIGSKTLTPAWALDKAVANAEVSYLFAPESVYAWLSAPRRIDIEYAVASVRVGIWGYKAVGVTRTTDIIPVDATTADA